MILGLGSDICDIRRIERALERFGDALPRARVHRDERRRAERRNGQARSGTYAKRFAAKEACAKALGTGFARGVFMSDHRRGEPARRPADAAADGGAVDPARRTHAARHWWRESTSR